MTSSREAPISPWSAKKTTPAQPTFVALREERAPRAFPLALEPFLCTRFEMADFAVAARELGVGYIGICCGGAPGIVAPERTTVETDALLVIMRWTSAVIMTASDTAPGLSVTSTLVKFDE